MTPEDPVAGDAAHVDVANDEATATRRTWLLLIALTVATLAARLWDLGRFELWEDEAATWWYARLIAEGRLLEGIRLEPTPPLYYGLVAAVTGLLGTSEAALRLPSVLFGALCVPMAFVLARSLAADLAPRRAVPIAWWTAGFVAIHPLLLFYSREARVYPLLLLLTMALWWAMWRALRRGSTAWQWATVAAVLVVLCGCHYYGIFLVGTAGLVVLLCAPTAATRRRGLLAVGAAGLAFLPYVVHTLPHLRGSEAAWSVERLYQVFPGERNFGRVLEMGALGADYPPFLRQIAHPPTPPWLRWTTLGTQLCLVLVGIAGINGLRRQKQTTTFVFVAWLVPLLVPWAVTHTWRPIFHLGRHDLYGLWGTAFLVGLGLASLASLDTTRARRTLLVVAAGVLLVAAAARTLALLGQDGPTSSRSVAAFLVAQLDESRQERIEIVALGVRRLGTEHALRQLLPPDAAPSIRSFPGSIDRHPGWSDPGVLVATEEGRDALAAEAAARVAEWRRDRVDRVVVLTEAPPPRDPGAGLSPEQWIDATLLRALSEAGWRSLPEATRPDLRAIAFARPDRPASGPQP